jgi:hypothetical protein
MPRMSLVGRFKAADVLHLRVQGLQIRLIRAASRGQEVSRQNHNDVASESSSTDDRIWHM